MRENNKIKKFLKEILKDLDELKAENVVKIDIKDRSALGDYLIIANGNSSRHINAIASKIIKKNKKKIITFRELNHFRDFLSINDISNAVRILCLKKITGIYNIGSGKKIYLKKIAQIFCKKFNKKGNFINSSSSFTYLISNNRKLCKLGWMQKTNFLKELNKFK